MTASREVSLTGIPHIGRATLIGMLVGWLVVTVPVLIGMLMLGASGEALLFAGHVGFFGGMGFGGMYGAVIQADRFERSGAAGLADVPPGDPEALTVSVSIARREPCAMRCAI